MDDPEYFHISVHTHGHLPNNASQLYLTFFKHSTPNSSLFFYHFLIHIRYKIEQQSFEVPLLNLDTQHITIAYDPSTDGGTLSVQLNDQATQLVVSNLSIAEIAALDPLYGTAYVGFTAGSHRYKKKERGWEGGSRLPT